MLLQAGKQSAFGEEDRHPQTPIQTEAGGTISMPSEEPTTEEKTEAPTETTTKAPAKEPTTKKQTPSNNTGGGSLEAKIKKLNGKGKKIYITFDDGPSNHTPQIIDNLDKYNVKATFFVIGNGKTTAIFQKSPRRVMQSVCIHIPTIINTSTPPRRIFLTTLKRFQSS